ncbi:phosphotransferase [Vagococcus carniphilus]|uniref:aminoglycoside phosphotransferase family protein n=1 Tax=Vagococcus carniphilus TaxID=218144 RepID=UPI00288E9DFC|nr:phosphotransferase [Vagococcus carniphilus]MDT2815274.1 phosphotransferase [Vagococcus carniphilus]MDT2850261.1 phosphotransferase [Vagococcus carniphilus]MDT2865345.1 phosphotransferase [Vagococcus carniphilus]
MDLNQLMKQNNWQKVIPIQKGWSADEKYQVITKEGESLLLRVSDKSNWKEKQVEFQRIQLFNQLPDLMSRVIKLEEIPHTDKIFMLLSYLEGNDLESVLPLLTEENQYDLGIEAGKILKKFHQIDIEVDEAMILRKLQDKKIHQLNRFLNSQYTSLPQVEVLEKYVRENSYQILQQSVSLQHGDFHAGNLIYTNNKKVGVIDFNRSDIGDPYEEFYKLQMFGKESSQLFVKGIIMGYFENDVPESFWGMQKFYVFHTSLFSITWAENFFKEDVEKMIERMYQNLADYDDGRRLIPKWWE